MKTKPTESSANNDQGHACSKSMQKEALSSKESLASHTGKALYYSLPEEYFPEVLTVCYEPLSYGKLHLKEERLSDNAEREHE